VKPELISFNICPYVERSVIMLAEKGVDFDITYIDVYDPPAWFHDISPLGKVPLLRYRGEVIFESAVINEFLDETHPPPLHPADPLTRARHRGWIEFGSNLNGELYNMMMAKDAEQLTAALEPLRHSVTTLEARFGDGPLFAGERFSLVDAALAPTLRSLALLEELYRIELLAPHPRLRGWLAALCVRPSVQGARIPEFNDVFLSFMERSGSQLNQLRR